MSRERLAREADALLDRAEPSGGIEIVAELAAPLSLAAIADVMGIPAADHARFSRWADDVGAAAESPSNAVLVQSACASVAAASGRIGTLAAERTELPEHDVLSVLLRPDADGQRLAPDEITGLATLLLLAGHDTTTHLIANGLLALLQYPEQLERLRATPELWPCAVHELLRWTSPLHGVLRTATRDLEIGGRRIRRGESLALWLAAGNRDPARFGEPERLDIGRAPNVHVAFGHGVHHCLGASLGALVAEVAMARVVDRFPQLRLASPRVEWQGSFLFRGQRSLRVLF